MRRIYLSLFAFLIVFISVRSPVSGMSVKKEYFDKKENTEAKEEAFKPLDPFVFNGTGKRGGKIVLPFLNNPKTFNPIIFDDTETEKILKGDLYLGLTGYDYEKMTTYPLLARSLEMSEDGKIYTYKIRRGLKWSDGQPFTVDDVLFTWQVLTDPKTLSKYKDVLKQSDGSFPEIKKIDDETLRFTFKELNVLFQDVLIEIFIIPKHKWEKDFLAGNFMNAMTVATDPKEMPTLGPFVIEKFVADQRLVLRRNPYYFKFDQNGVQLPYFDKVIFLMSADFNAQAIKFQNGETEMHEVRPEHFDLMKRDESSGNYTVTDLGPGLQTYWLGFNMYSRNSKAGTPFLEPKKLKIFSDKRFRQAISYSIDREGIVKTVFLGRATPIYNLESPGNKLWFNPDDKKYPFDLERAKTLLAEMGLKDQNGDGYLEHEDGSELAFTIKTNSENISRIQIGNLIKEDFKKLGLKVDLQPVPFNNLLTTLDDTFDYDAIILGWGSSVPPDPALTKNVLLSSGRHHMWNPMQEKPETEWEKRIDELVALNQGTLNLSERQNYYKEITKIWGEELPQIMLVSPNMYVGIKNKFGNIKPSVMRPYYDWNIDEIYDQTLK